MILSLKMPGDRMTTVAEETALNHIDLYPWTMGYHGSGGDRLGGRTGAAGDDRERVRYETHHNPSLLVVEPVIIFQWDFGIKHLFLRDRL